MIKQLLAQNTNKCIDKLASFNIQLLSTNTRVVTGEQEYNYNKRDRIDTLSNVNKSRWIPSFSKRSHWRFASEYEKSLLADGNSTLWHG